MTALPLVSRRLPATLRPPLGEAKLILEIKIAWVTAKNIFSNDHAPKMLRDSGG